MSTLIIYFFQSIDSNIVTDNNKKDKFDFDDFLIWYLSLVKKRFYLPFI